jgi:hypothetical protein
MREPALSYTFTAGNVFLPWRPNFHTEYGITSVLPLGLYLLPDFINFLFGLSQIPIRTMLNFN